MRVSRRKRGAVTIDEVARAAGVSAMTVSRVINGGYNVREATRTLVTEAVERLNYRPSSAARNLAAGEAMHVGLLYANPSAAYLSQLLIGALHSTRSAGCHLVIEACGSEDAAEQAEVTRMFAASEVEGVILPPPLSDNDAVLAELTAAGIPVVTVARGSGVPGGMNVRMDDYGAAQDMTRHLLDLGHRRIGFIKGNVNHEASQERHRGFVDALAAFGLDPASAPVEAGDFTFRSGLSATERLLAGNVGLTAIFASNDDMAAAANSVVHRQGLSVPGDISVVGFDDTWLATSVWPELTTIRQPIAEMAEAALDLLLGDIRARRDGQAPAESERVLAHSLVVRESSAAANFIL